MQSGKGHKLTRMGRWQRAAAVVLLGLAFIDLTVIDVISPQLCAGGGLSGDIAFSAGAAVELDMVIDARAPLPLPGDHSDDLPVSTDEDCFCCCSHILPEYAFGDGPVRACERAANLSACVLPSAPPQDLFHPPRLG